MSNSQNIPYGFCLCGCGRRTALSTVTDQRRDARRGRPNRYITGHNVSRPLQERFWEKVAKDGPNGCWVWTAALRNGYGHIGGRNAGEKYHLYAHRLAHEWLIGPIPEGFHVDHLCRNRACVNPAHLEAVTQAENNRRAARERDGLGRFT